ncbi:DNA alkylation repair protein [Candidatus Thorarchaeota archaeon]|nr:MAG: DNA alkylation repair protein [Candidatus Thorarchaeota archaeon]
MILKIGKHIHTDLITQSDPYRKEKIAGYLKTSSLKFIGVELPDIHKIVTRNIKGVNLDDMPELMDELWKIETFETRLAAIDIMKEYGKKGPIDIAMSMADRWIDDADTWAITDPLCSPTIGSMIIRDSKVESILDSWKSSENFWRRRCSVLPYLYLTLKTQYKLEYAKKILEVVTPHISDSEFFVGKAVGWVLRELSKREPELVRNYFEKYNDKMTKLVIRAGMKKL